MRIALVNMPFADWDRPSVALSQLAAYVNHEFGDAVETDVRYINLDFALLFGAGDYKIFVNQSEHLIAGVGEWLFRALAFPDVPDNADSYFGRYFADDGSAGFRARLMQVRSRLRDFCNKMIDDYRLAEADIVGFTSMFSQNIASIALARMIKERNPNVITVMGGANCETPMGTVLAEYMPALDFIFSGPALHSFPEFVRRVLDGRPESADDIPGVISRRNVNRPGIRESMGRDRDIDDYVRPDFGGFVDKFKQCEDELRATAGSASPRLYFETSRGCWWGEKSHCTFCGLNGLGIGYRAMAPEKALAQFEWLFEYAPWCKSFHCTDNILPRNYMREVLPKMRPPADVSVFYEVKVPISDRDFKSMAQAGVRIVQPGIEALATSTLKLMAKGTTSFLNLQFLQKCLKYDVEPSWNLLMGFPGEEAEVFEKYVTDLPSLTHLPPPDGAFLVRFDRYSPYFNKAAEFGLDLAPLEFYRLAYPVVPDERLFDLAYFFVDDNLGPYQVHSAEWLGKVELQVRSWRAAWQRDTPPRLALLTDDAGELGVLDTRSEQHRWTPVQEDGAALLRRLASPSRPSKLVTELGMSAERLAELVTEFTERRFLFLEGDTMISLVMLDEVTDDGPDEPVEVAAPRLLPLVQV